MQWQNNVSSAEKQTILAKIKDNNKRALQSLDKRDHITYLNRYGVLEYKFGNVVEGRTQFENILASFPKRADLW